MREKKTSGNAATGYRCYEHNAIGLFSKLKKKKKRMYNRRQ